MSKKAYLVLEDGRSFVGKSFGSEGTFTGEVVFNTSMTGYQEILTDPSYYGQMVIMTYSQIGNYGVTELDNESDKPYLSALIVKEYFEYHSNWRSQGSLADYLKKSNIPGIEGIDTRSLVKHIRDCGSLRAVLSTEISDIEKLTEMAKNSPSMEGLNLADEVSTKEVKQFKAKNEEFRVSAIDFGIKTSIINQILEQGISVKLFPSSANIDEVLADKPDGVFLSNGPGDPAVVTGGIKLVEELLETKIPIFGICLGHQILSNAIGAKTYKLKFGHHGGNHPVKNLATEKIEISAQNHNFAVDETTLPESVIVTHVNLNDNTIEGIKSTVDPWFTVQYHPEAGPGPHDSRYLFADFKELLTANK